MKKIAVPFLLIILLATTSFQLFSNSSELIPQNYSLSLANRGISILLDLVIVCWISFTYFKSSNIPNTLILKYSYILGLTCMINSWLGIYNNSFLYLNGVLFVAIVELWRDRVKQFS